MSDRRPIEPQDQEPNGKTEDAANPSMRMGSDPATSVVSPSGEAHGVERLFICDTSIFPNGIGGPNPTLTAQAVATMMAEGIVRYLSA